MKHFGSLTTRQKTQITVAAVLVLLLAFSMIGYLPRAIDDANYKRVGAAVDQLAVEQAAVINRNVAKFQAVLEGQIKSLGLGAVLQQPAEDAWQAAAAQLQAANAAAGVISAKLISVNSNYQAMGLRFSQLARLSAVLENKEVYPESFEDAGKRVFDFLLPVKDEAGKVLGVLLVVADDRFLRDEAAQPKADVGSVLVQQQFPNSAISVVFRSVAGEGMQQVSQPAATSVPHWQVLIVPGHQLVEDRSIAALWQYLMQLVVLAACVAVLLFLNRRSIAIAKKIEEEHVTPIQIKGARKVDKGEYAEQQAAQGSAATDIADPLFQVGDVFDLDLDDDVLEVRAATPKATGAVKAAAASESYAVSPTIFRDYDIRGNADTELTDELAERIGRAFGSECIDQGQQRVILAGDGRLSTPRLKESALRGLLASGCSVIDIGMVPTPLMNFAANTIAGVSSGMMVTASHNPAEDNGFKMVINGHTLAGDDVQRIRQRVEQGDFVEGEGESSEQDVIDDYIDHIVSDIVLAGSYKVVVDCGNGVAGVVAPRLLEELGCDVVPLYCDVDGSFLNHQPDPSDIANLQDLIQAVSSEGADLGVAFDGDGDRLAVVTASGQVILPDSLLMLFAKDVVSRNPGTDIVFDVKSTRRLNTLITSCGGRPVMCKSGHSHIRNKMLETGAMLGGELSGHIFFKERWFGFDDGVYSAARLLEIMSIRDQDLDGIFATFPESACTPEIRIAVPEDKKFALVKQLADSGDWGNGKVSTLDGVRVDFAKGWGLVRASNTAAALTLRFEADDADSLATVQHVFKQQLQRVDSQLPLPF